MEHITLQKPSRKRKLIKGNFASKVIKLFLYVLLLDLAFMFLYPFLYMIITSIKSPHDLMDVTVNWLPNEIHFSNFTLSVRVLDYLRRFFNSSLVTVLATVGHLISCAYIGYGFARFKFTGKTAAFVMLLFAIIIPTQTIIIPQYMLFSQLGWVNTSLPMIIPSFFGYGLQGALFIFIFRQFFLSLPKSLEEAAQIDGCGIIKTFFRIALPTARSSIMVCLVLSLVWHWNDYFEPSIYLSRQDDFLLPMMLPQLYSLIKGGEAAGSTALNNMFTEGVAMAATLLVVLPLLIMYAFLQKKFIEGVERSGITGE